MKKAFSFRIFLQTRKNSTLLLFLAQRITRIQRERSAEGGDKTFKRNESSFHYVFRNMCNEGVGRDANKTV